MSAIEPAALEVERVDEPLIALTMDTDWAPDEVVEEAAQLVRGAGCKLTLFVTNRVAVKADEIAIHPNLTSISEPDTPISALMAMYPSARGIRSHSLVFTERLRPLYERFNLAYDSNAIAYCCSHIQAAPIGRRTLSLPLFFMDRFHMEMCGDAVNRWDVARLPLQSPGLKIFDLHPVHVLLNTPDVPWYERAKAFYQQPDRLRKMTAPGRGTRTFLEDLLSWIGHHRLRTFTMTELHDRFAPPPAADTTHPCAS